MNYFNNIHKILVNITDWQKPRSTDFKNENLVKVFFIHTCQHKVKLGGRGVMKSLLRGGGTPFLEFGTHCICLRFLNWYLYHNFIFLFYDNFILLYSKWYYLKTGIILLWNSIFYSNSSAAKKINISSALQAPKG